MTRHFDYCPSTSEGDNQSVRSSAPVVSRCFPGGYNVKLYISRGRLAWWLLAFLHSELLHQVSISFLFLLVLSSHLFSYLYLEIQNVVNTVQETCCKIITLIMIYIHWHYFLDTSVCITPMLSYSTAQTYQFISVNELITIKLTYEI